MASCTQQQRNEFYWKNFEGLMGSGLSDALRVKNETGEVSDGVDYEPDEFSAIDELPNGNPEPPEVSRKKALLRLLAREAGDRAGLTVEESEIQMAIDDFRCQHGLQLLDDTKRWMAEQNLTEKILVNVIRDGILLDKLGSQFADELDIETEVQARMATARR
jgi:hypothetical protein